MMSLWTVLWTAVRFVGPTATLLYPLYASIKALESPSKEDDEQWLTYWMLYSFLELFELVSGNVLAWIPVWPFIKLAIICWLVLPQFQGAEFVYVHIIRKHVRKLQERSEKKFTEGGIGKNLTADKSHVLDSTSPEVPASTERFIEENGEAALEKNTETEQSEKKFAEDGIGKNLTADKSHVLDSTRPEVPASTERFIEENGEEALEKNSETASREVANSLPSPTKEQQERY